jgi:hypothetical protein
MVARLFATTIDLKYPLWPHIAPLFNFDNAELSASLFD